MDFGPARQYHGREDLEGKNEFDNVEAQALAFEEKRIDAVLALVRHELVRARRKHPQPFKSLREGHSIIEEEYDEFWDEVKKDRYYDAHLELVQLGAMTLRCLLDCYPDTLLFKAKIPMEFGS